MPINEAVLPMRFHDTLVALQPARTIGLQHDPVSADRSASIAAIGAFAAAYHAPSSTCLETFLECIREGSREP
jgi:hypothetical protein